MKIKAAVVEKMGDPFVIKDDIELHDVGPTDVQVHMVASGICHSDEAIRKGDASLGYPVILGHEGAGIVEKVGSELQNLKPGDHVVMAFYADGLCDKCLEGILQLNVVIMLNITYQALVLTVMTNSKKMANIFQTCSINHHLPLLRLLTKEAALRLMTMLTFARPVL